LRQQFLILCPHLQVFITRAPNPRGKILVDENKHKPNPNCYVCSDKGEVILQLNIDRMSVKTFRDAVLLGGLGMRAPDVMDLFTHRILISSEEGETDGASSFRFLPRCIGTES
jgi:hypothetical protein